MELIHVHDRGCFLLETQGRRGVDA